MVISRAVKKLLPWETSETLLVVESDGLKVRAAVFSIRGGGAWAVNGYSESGAVDFSAALAETLEALKERGVVPPRQAILLAPQVQATILPLPVDPKRPRPFREMQELIRWELEPYLARNRAMRIGGILVGRGDLEAADLERVTLAMEEQRAAAAQSGRPRRFGEIALEAGLISQEQLDEALSIQESLQEVESEPVCGWTPLSGQAVDGKWNWLVCGMANSLRDDFVKRFERLRIRLRAIYPLVGCASASLNGQAIGSLAILEYQAGVLGYTRLSAGEIVKSHSRYVPDMGDLARSCLDALEEDVDTVSLAGRWPDIDRTKNELAASLERPCGPLLLDASVELPADMEAVSTTGMLGAARHFVESSGTKSAVRIQTQDPRDPLRQQPFFWIASTLCTVIVLWIVLEIAMAAKHYTLSEHARLAGDIQSEEESLKALSAHTAGLEGTKRFLEEELVAREALLPTVLGVLQATVSDGIVLSRLFEDATGVIHLSGWAVSERAIQTFKLDLSRELRSTGMAAINLQVRASSEPQGRVVYSFKFDLLPESQLKRLGTRQ